MIDEMNIDIFYNKNGVLNRNKLKENWVKDNLPDLYLKVIEMDLPNINLFSQKLWHYLNNNLNYLNCDWCGEENKRWQSFTTGYKNGCSRSCAIQLSRPKGIETRKKNTIEKYGVNHTSQLQSVKDKMKSTNIEKYNGVAPACDDNILDKMKSTTKEKYGVEFPLQSSDIYDKLKKTNIERYGVDSVLKSDIIKDRLRKSNLSKYGVEWQISSDITISKIKKSNIEKYGEDHVWKVPEIHKKALDTTNKKYGRDLIIGKIVETKRNMSLNEAKIKYPNLEFLNYGEEFNIYCNKHKGNFNINNGLLYQRDKFGYEICTVCNEIGVSNTSKMEEDLSLYLESLGIKVIRNNRWGNKEIDIYLPDYKIGIEMNGTYWHSELFKDKSYHQEKTKYFDNLGIQILHVWESDWLFKNDIVKSIILSKIGKSKEVIYARKCSIINLTNKGVRCFLNENHLQGYISSKVCLGLEYNGNLVSVMTFSPSKMRHIKNGDYWELVRFCNKINTTVIGGADRLLSKFRKGNNVELVSYAKLDYSSPKNSIYDKLGFKLEKITNPGYYWCKGIERFNRFKFRKSVLIKEGFDPNLTESQIMYNRGYYKSWDSGNLKFIL